MAVSLWTLASTTFLFTTIRSELWDILFCWPWATLRVFYFAIWTRARKHSRYGVGGGARLTIPTHPCSRKAGRNHDTNTTSLAGKPNQARIRSRSVLQRSGVYRDLRSSRISGDVD